MPKKINYQKLEKDLTRVKKSCWEIWEEKTKNASFNFADDYKSFLNSAKTERESVAEGIKLAEKKGFKNIKHVKVLKPGDKIYFSYKDKGLILARVGKDSLEQGINIIMAHIDSPHLDLKVNPLYEDEGLGFFKTHYYGGIKKYQWPTIALALHGIAYLANGKKADINIGEKDNEPVFMITDLLPHLDRPSQAGSEIKNREVKGEDLNLLIGTLPVKDEKIKEKVKLALLEYLFNHYGIKEEDLASAEISVVPSEKARDLGFDRSLISAYGHDDRICAYAAIMSLFSAKECPRTQICIWIDREETGSEGGASAKSILLENFISMLLRLSNDKSNLESVYNLFARSKALSADVSAALDPDYKDVYELRNVFRLGYGATVEKYTGSGGKYFTSEASAQFVQEIRAIFKKDKNIVYQLGGGLGKIDQGGGGTIAKYLANRNIEVIDIGVPLLNMHAPLEIASKADLYSLYLAFKAFYEN